MTQQRVHRLVFAILILCPITTCFAAEVPDQNDPNRYLNAVREFVDNVLKYGRDTYGTKFCVLTKTQKDTESIPCDSNSDATWDNVAESSAE